MTRRLLAFGALVQVACAPASTAVRPDEPEGDPGEWRPYPGARGPASPASPGRAIAARAAGWVGLRVSAISRAVPDDCTGLVRLAYGAEGIDLLADGTERGENGVSAIYRSAKRAGAVHSGNPQPGDLVFFRETYDRNRDGSRNDGLTHVGIVEAVDGAGTVTFIHRGGSGVSRSRFNPRFPAQREDGRGEVLNEVLRPPSRHLRAYLAGELFVGYASPERLR